MQSQVTKHTTVKWPIHRVVQFFDWLSVLFLTLIGFFVLSLPRQNRNSKRLFALTLLCLDTWVDLQGSQK